MTGMIHFHDEMRHNFNWKNFFKTEFQFYKNCTKVDELKRGTDVFVRIMQIYVCIFICKQNFFMYAYLTVLVVVVVIIVIVVVVLVVLVEFSSFKKNSLQSLNKQTDFLAKIL